LATGDAYGYGNNNPITLSDPSGLCSTVVGGQLYCGGGQRVNMDGSGSSELVDVDGSPARVSHDSAGFVSNATWFDGGAPRGGDITGSYRSEHGATGRPWHVCMTQVSNYSACGAPPVYAEFDSEADLAAFTGLVVNFFENGLGGAEHSVGQITTTVAGYSRADGRFVSSYARCRAGLGHLADVLPARNARYITRAGGASSPFLMLL
jgi:hypothetical protein